MIYLDSSAALAHLLAEDRLPPEDRRQFQEIARPAKRKLEAINEAVRLEDLKVRRQTDWRN